MVADGGAPEPASPAPGLGRALRSCGWIAAYEVGEAARTRLLQLLLVAYAASVALSTWALVRLVAFAERAVAERLGVPTTRRPGTLIEETLRSGSVTEPLRAFLGNGVADQLLDGSSFVALWFGATASVALPALALLSASASISGEVRTRGIRWLLSRATRLEVAAGKLLGQGVLVAVAALLGAAVAFTLSTSLMVVAEPRALAGELLLRAGTSLAFALPFVGLGLGASCWVSGAHTARAIAFGVLFALLWGYARLQDHVGPGGLGRAADGVLLLLPPSLWTDLWGRDPGTLLATAARGGVQGLLFFTLGWARFRGRDL
ncbi:ABC transporter permease subunit [Myxococcota bacterium]|nr:ABC transporter permease subunit [Myxococcota bacterium]